MTHEFMKGMPTDTVQRMLAINLVENYCEGFEKETGFSTHIDWKQSTVDVLRGRVIQEVVGYMNIGTIGEYTALQSERNGKEIILGADIDIISCEHIKENRITIGTEQLHGRAYRRAIMELCYREEYQEGASYDPWQMKVGGTYFMHSRDAEQVNNMPDLLDMLDGEKNFGHLALYKIEGITEMTDDEVMNYDFMNCVPKGHKGGGYAYDDSNEVEADYPASYGNCGIFCLPHVWLLRGKTLSLAVNCEGHSYSKYVVIPRDMLPNIRKYVNEREDLRKQYEIYKSYRTA